MKYSVSVYSGYADDNPKVSEIVDTYGEAEDIYFEWLESALDYEISHSPFTVTEKDYEIMRETIARFMFINEEGEVNV